MIKKVESVCKIGLVRETNQDSILCRNNDSKGLFVVADGMGGYTDGEIASGMIAQQLNKWWDNLLNDSANRSISDVAKLCENELLEINLSVYNDFQKRGVFGGSTVVVFLVWDDCYAVLHSGDSRAYIISKRKMNRLTTDDVWDNLESTKAMFTPEEIAGSDNSGKLTFSMGILESTSIHISIGKIEKGDLFFLCSDGVHKYCPEEKMQKIIQSTSLGNNLSKKIKKIEDEINKNGAGDNYSAILCLLQ